MDKNAKPAPQADADVTETGDAPPKKFKKKLMLTAAAIILLIAGGAGALLLMAPPPSESIIAAEKALAERKEMEALAHKPPKFIGLGTFTANLIREEGDRYLQVAISLKVTKPELEEKIKANDPEILHRVNMLLQSKRPSELASFEGKEILAQQIREQVEYVLGLRKTAPIISAEQSNNPDTLSTARGGISDVLFTSFIIQ